ncbi:MAG: peptidylprolyl isomerase [Pirellulales bacterium]
MRFRGICRRVWLIALLVSAGCSAAQKAPPAPATAAPPTSAQAGNTTIVAIAPPAQACCKKQTLPEFLGFKGFFQKLGGAGAHLFSRLLRATDLTGRFPALQPQPPLLPLADPANLSPDAPPVVQAAAEAKQEEDKAAQKVMALRYLGTLGCGGCYDKIEDALLEALADCTEGVRYEAALALKGNSSSGRGRCIYCSSGSCCSEKIRKKLHEVAEKTDAKGEFLETSERVRRVARLALDACGGAPASTAPDVPTEGPSGNQPTPASPAGSASVARAGGVDKSADWIADIALIAFHQTSQDSRDPEVILAQVNGQPIYDHEVSPLVEARMAQLSADGVPLDPARTRDLLARELQRAIDIKLLMQAAQRDLTTQVAATGGGADALAALDLVQVEKWLAEQIDVSDHVSILELTQEFAAQKQRFGTPPRVRWERITADVRQFKSRDEAYAALVAVRARAAGQPAVAGPNDRQLLQTETYSWTTPSEVSSPAISRTLFRLPVGKLSPILEEREQLHVIRVLEHQPGGSQPFQEVVDLLRQDVLKRRQAEAEQQFLANLRSGAQIWTVLDAAPGSGSPGHDVQRADVQQAEAQRAEVVEP